jgi:hypothetical protein
VFLEEHEGGEEIISSGIRSSGSGSTRKLCMGRKRMNLERQPDNYGAQFVGKELEFGP